VEPPSGLTATAPGADPTVIVAITVLLAVSTTDTVPPFLLVTKAWVPSGLNATPTGASKPTMVAITTSVAVSITDTVPSSLLVT
jgi:hypothetical protein